MKLASFDIFDTLIKRDVYKPTDVFILMEKNKNIKGFAEARINAAETRVNEACASIDNKLDKLDKEQVAKLLNELKSIRENYNAKVDELKNLTAEINSSTEWIDITVKQEFINTCNSYNTLYKEHSNKMELYEQYLTFKTGEMNDMEQKHTLEGGKYE